MKIKITITLEYEVYPKYYPEDATPEKILAIDLENAKEDVHVFLNIFPYQIAGEIIQW